MLKTLQNIIMSFVLIVIVIIPIAWTIDEISTFSNLDETQSETYSE